ncbi:MarR family winged helix-turn-helix transcriptional regulator [Mucisphaera sp.]|uniref:MarR family winged helix-turn-helix transcriptional regulator n=1 Tax=Mucisphaera sp. TaxID=2913024 RepID=UPI003D0C4F92
MPRLQKELGKKKAFTCPTQEAYLNIVRTHHELSEAFTKLFKSYGLSESAYNVLRILRGHHPQPVPSQEICGQLVVRVPDVTRLVDRLVTQGLADRQRTEEDRRLVLVSITRQGLDLLKRLDAPLTDLHNKQLGRLSETELNRLSRLLEKARAGCND